MLEQFDNCLAKVNIILRFIGMSLTEEDNKRTTWQRFKYHWICLVHLTCLNLSISQQVTWLVLAIANGTSLLEITYMIPCVTYCMLGNFKIYYFMHKVQHINDVVVILKNVRRSKGDTIEEKIIKTWLQVLINFCKSVIVPTIFGVGAFVGGTFITIGNYYYTTGTIKLSLPFLFWYPFDELKLQNWPLAFTQQMWTAWVAVAAVLGPDSFFAVCCTFLQIQFSLLQRDLEEIVIDSSGTTYNNTFKKHLVHVVNQHRQLIRCVELIDQVYSKSTLFNVVISCLIICAAGFNMMVFKNYVMMAPFCSFLIYGLLQVFLYCYYSDHVAISSMGIGDSIYNSSWYEVGATEQKYLLTILIRFEIVIVLAIWLVLDDYGNIGRRLMWIRLQSVDYKLESQKPCQFTAYLFSNINLRVFSRILSTSWSYINLLNRIYDN